MDRDKIKVFIFSYFIDVIGNIVVILIKKAAK